MMDLRIVDTFPEFLSFWKRVQEQPPEAQVQAWQVDYMSRWPELLTDQIEDYRSQGLDWRQIAVEKVFPHLPERLDAMQAAHTNLLNICLPLFAQAQQAFGLNTPAVFVIYVGIGCGAGWVTTQFDTPAILFGLENIAESGWSGAEAIRCLVAHEIGHLVHHHWRDQARKPIGSGPLWQLYEEGFAQYIESTLVGSTTWHQTLGENGGDWLAWCQSNQAWLAAEFLRRVDSGESVRPFFGSWFDLRGKHETGYFLGYEFVKILANALPLENVALLEDVEETARFMLTHMVDYYASGDNLP